MSASEGSRAGILLPAVDRIKLYPGQRGFVWNLRLCLSGKKKNNKKNFDIFLGVLNPEAL